MLKRVIIFLLFLLLSPGIVNAASIEKFGSSLRDSDVKIGNSTHLYLDIDIDYSDEKENTGLFMIMVRFDYNDDDILITDITSRGFSSGVFIDEETKYKYIISVIDFSSTCFDGVFFCGDYHLDLAMFIKDNNKKSTDITINNVFLASTIYDYEKQTFDEENINIFEKSYNKKLTVKVHDGIINTMPSTIATSRANINKDNPIKSITTKKKVTTKKTTTKNTSTSRRETSSAITDDEVPEEIEQNDFIENVIEDSKRYIEMIKEKDNQKRLIKGGLIILGVIILIIIIIKLKNHKLNKKFKDF